MKIKSIWIVIGINLFSLQCTFAQHEPASGDFGKLFIEAINSDSETRQSEIIRQVFAPSELHKHDKILEMLKQLRTSFAPIEYHTAEIALFNRPGLTDVMHIYAKKKNSRMWHDFQMRLESLPSRKFIGLGFIAEVSEPVYLPNGNIDQSETLDWLDHYVKKLNEEYDLSGSILIAQGSAILYENYFGYADALRKKRIDSTSLFNMGSGNKMFTALGVAKLVEDGRLKWDDKMTKFIDGFNDQEKASPITIHHLLSHTSGLGEYWAGQTDSAIARCTTIAEHLPFVFKAGFEFPAGTDYRYCNSNFIVLGAIIEKISGKDYFDYIRETILKPAGMHVTDSYWYNDSNVYLVRPLTRKGNSWEEAPSKNRGSSTGGGYSNVREILAFSSALKHFQIVGRSTFETMIAVKNGGLPHATESYGYGFQINKTGWQTAHGHGGIARGVNFEFRYFPQQDITLVIFCNQDNGAYDDLKKNAIKLITGQR